MSTDASEHQARPAWLGVVRAVLITDRRLMGDGSVVAFGDAVARAVAALPPGAALVQVREKDLDGGPLLQLVHAAMASGAPVLVNDRLDVALAAGAAGVHLPESGLSVAEARRLAPAGFVIGRSRHAPRASRPDAPLAELVRRAQADPADAQLWLRVGFASARAGAASDAVAAYLAVARHYHRDGFWLKAVAVYKQLLAIEPRHAESLRALVQLYRDLGLPSDAALYEAVEPGPPAAELPDLVQLGPIFETPGKGPAIGAAGLAAARDALAVHGAFGATRPRLVAVGGISDRARAVACRAAGADAVAAIRTAWTGDVGALA